ncbi:MAG: NAD(P)(+) transhydrogenase (Re/Si-specific) subunit beta, partial [Myxococcales bacterium]|nr:NAD(P)(+) transhydrogenase (Re/Si-specific) subunit beta [Myxococcales bacterium]
MSGGLLTVAYLVAGVLFIRSLGGLSKQETARRGNVFGVVGMVLAIAATIFHDRIGAFGIIGGAVLIGGVIGTLMAHRVVMTAMPELVALLHSFVGLAAVLVGISSVLAPAETLHGAAHAVHSVELWIGIAVGAITFTGSIIAWGKLRGSISGRPLLLPGRHLLNLVVAIGIVGLAIPFMQQTDGEQGMLYVYAMTGLASLLGIHLVMAIGGADMPVVVSLLNSYSGWAAAAAGFVLQNDLLIVTGALVGSSGAILSIIMCRAMNRSILNVVFGGFGTASGAVAKGDVPEGEVHEITASGLAEALRLAKRVVIVPGYGMAVARAQHPVQELTRLLRERGVQVCFAIHPVAGRLPGHMNVLLAEAGVPYDIVLEMDEVNEDFPETDVTLVIGANDIVNPGALTDEASPIYGMPVLEAWKGAMTVVFKRSMASGYARRATP